MAEKRIYELISIITLTSSISLLIYPDLFLSAKIRFNSGHDITIPFQAFLYNFDFLKESYFNHWNIYDQTNHTFFHFTQGFYTFPAIVESFVALMLNFFISDTTKVIHLVHTYVYYLICFIFISLGSIRIFRHYGVILPQRIIFIPLTNFLFSVPILSGVMTGFIYSLTPLLIFFIIKLIDEKKIEYLFYFFILYFFAFAQIPTFSVGYFFVQFHFILVILIALIFYFYFFNKKKYLDLKKNVSNFKLSKIYFLSLISVIIIFFFNLETFLSLKETNTLSQAGLSGGDRFEKFLNPIKYFKTYVPTNPIIQSLQSYFIYDKNLWYYMPTFLGTSVVLISIIGLLIEKKRVEILIFAFSVIYIICLQGPRDLIFHYPSTYAHLFNSILNPFSFLFHHSHMSLININFFLLPLFACGLVNLNKLKDLSNRNLTLIIFLILIFNLLIYSFFETSKNSFYLSSIISVFILLIFFSKFYNVKSVFKNISFIVICFSLIAELIALKTYLNEVPYTGERIHKRNVLNANNNSFTDHFLDLQNISKDIFPIKFILNKPEVKFHKKREKKILEDVYFVDQTYKGYFYKNIFLERVLKDPFIYEIRHKIYSEIYKDDFLKTMSEILHVELFNNSVSSEQMSYEKFMTNNHYINSIYLNDYVSNDKNDEIKKINDLKFYEIEIEIEKIKFYKQKGDFNIYFFKNENDIPKYLNTNFIFENQIELVLNSKKMKNVQNIIFEKYQFDVNNYKSGQTFFSLPIGEKIKSLKVSYKRFHFLDKFMIKKNQFIFDVNTKKDNFLLLRFPYDKNWKIKINGEESKYLRANKYWLGIPLYENGKKRLVLEYSFNRYLLNNFGILIYYLSQFTLILIILLYLKRKN